MNHRMKALFAAGGAVAAALGIGAATTPAHSQGKTITLCWAAWDPANALVELDRPLDYAGHYTHDGIRTLVTSSRFQWPGLARLLVAAAAVSVVDAPDIAHARWERIIGRAVMRLRSRK